MGKVIESNLKWFRYEWIWEKPNTRGFLNSHYMPLKCHENILIFYKHKPTYNPQFAWGKPYTGKHIGGGSKNYRKFKEDYVTVSDGRRYPRDVIKFNCETGYHPTQKPVPLLEYMIKTYTNSGETVLDCCMGSGSTGVAAIKTAREFIGIEKEKDYYAIAKKRIEETKIENGKGDDGA
jgi:site-specific DNA-methyltransferase (adenine-specific)